MNGFPGQQSSFILSSAASENLMSIPSISSVLARYFTFSSNTAHSSKSSVRSRAFTPFFATFSYTKQWQYVKVGYSFSDGLPCHIFNITSTPSLSVSRFMIFANTQDKHAKTACIIFFVDFKNTTLKSRLIMLLIVPSQLVQMASLSSCNVWVDLVFPSLRKSPCCLENFRHFPVKSISTLGIQVHLNIVIWMPLVEHSSVSSILYTFDSVHLIGRALYNNDSSQQRFFCNNLVQHHISFI